MYLHVYNTLFLNYKISSAQSFYVKYLKFRERKIFVKLKRPNVVSEDSTRKILESE